MIEINSVYKYVDDVSKERIRVIDMIDDYIYIVNIDGATSMPRKELIETIVQEITTEKLVAIKDPFV